MVRMQFLLALALVLAGCGKSIDDGGSSSPTTYATKDIELYLDNVDPTRTTSNNHYVVYLDTFNSGIVRTMRTDQVGTFVQDGGGVWHHASTLRDYDYKQHGWDYRFIVEAVVNGVVTNSMSSGWYSITNVYVKTDTVGLYVGF